MISRKSRCHLNIPQNIDFFLYIYTIINIITFRVVVYKQKYHYLLKYKRADIIHNTIILYFILFLAV